jgi:hypothetical protein
MSTNYFSKLQSVAKRSEKEFEYEGTPITIREMSGDMRDYFDADAKKRVKFKGRHPDLNTLQTEGQRALVVAMTLVDPETKELAFDYKDAEDLAQLGELSASFLDKVFEEAAALCGLSAEAEDTIEGNL